MNASSKHLVITSLGLPILALLALLWLLHYLKKNPPTKMTIINNTGKDIYLRLLEAGFNINMAKYLLSQAAHETGNFTSSIFKENNNLFGMKRPVIRQTTATGENKGHAVYNSIEDSIKDMALYLKSRGYLSNYQSIEAYVKQLKEKSYFEDSQANYLTGVTNFYKLYFG